MHFDEGVNFVLFQVVHYHVKAQSASLSALLTFQGYKIYNLVVCAILFDLYIECIS